MNELVSANNDEALKAALPSFMIDASHNTKDPLVDLIQSLENISVAYTKALLVDRNALHAAQESNNVVVAEQILQDAFLTDVRPLVAEARVRNGAAIHPIKYFIDSDVRANLIAQRGSNTIATGL
jgi:L-rhamnose isomerase / sugar isomerase